jgi:hypothetical protein
MRRAAAWERAWIWTERVLLHWVGDIDALHVFRKPAQSDERIGEAETGCGPVWRAPIHNK